MDLDLDYLKSICDEATPGPLYAFDARDGAPGKDTWRIVDEGTRRRWDKYNTSARYPFLATVYNRGDARFISAFPPETIRHLIARAQDADRLEFAIRQADIHASVCRKCGDCEWLDAQHRAALSKER